MNEFFVGCAFLAMQHKAFPFKQSMRCFEKVKRPAIAVLWNTFGRQKKGIRYFLQSQQSKPHLVHFYLLNSVCVRNNNCQQGELNPSWSKYKWRRRLTRSHWRLENQLRRRTKKLRRFIERHANENTHISLAVALEDNLTDKAARNLIEIVRQEWPYDLIRNPMHNTINSSIAGADMLELHDYGAPLGPKAAMYASLDGNDIEFPHREPTVSPSRGKKEVRGYLSRAKRSGCRAVFLWSAQWQGIEKGTAASSPKPRSRSIWIPTQDFDWINRRLLEVESNN